MNAWIFSPNLLLWNKTIKQTQKQQAISEFSSASVSSCKSTHFHFKGFVPGLVLKQRWRVTWHPLALKKTATEETRYDFNLPLIMFILKKVDDSNPLNFFQWLLICYLHVSRPPHNIIRYNKPRYTSQPFEPKQTIEINIDFVLKHKLQDIGIRSPEETALINLQVLPKCAMVIENLYADMGARRVNRKKLKYYYKILYIQQNHRLCKF